MSGMDEEPRRTPDPRFALASEVASMTAQGWRVESHSDYAAVLVQPHKTPGQAFARGGLIGMAWNARRSNEPRRVTLSVNESGRVSRRESN